MSYIICGTRPKSKVNTAHKMKLFVIQDIQDTGVVHRGGGCVCVCVEGRYGGAGERTPPTIKYLDKFLTVLLATFTTGLVFVRQLK